MAERDEERDRISIIPTLQRGSLCAIWEATLRSLCAIWEANLGSGFPHRRDGNWKPWKLAFHLAPKGGKVRTEVWYMQKVEGPFCSEGDIEVGSSFPESGLHRL